MLQGRAGLMRLMNSLLNCVWISASVVDIVCFMVESIVRS